MAIQHSAITADADNHEPKGAITAASGKVYIANGAGSGTWDFTPQAINMDIDNTDTVTDYYMVIPYNANIIALYCVIDGAITTADKVLTMSIGGVAVTDGALTIAYSGSAAGDVDSCFPSALNAITAGAAVKIAATGGSGGAKRAHLTLVYKRTS